MQHVVDHLLGEPEFAGMVDADSQAPEVRRAELCLDVLQALLAGVAAAALDLRHAGREVEIVVRDQNLADRDPVEVRERRHGAPRQVHVGGRLEEPRGAPVHRGASDLPEELRFPGEAGAGLRGDPVDHPEAGLVARTFVLAAHVAEADHEANPVHCGSCSVRKRGRPPGGGPGGRRRIRGAGERAPAGSGQLAAASPSESPWPAAASSSAAAPPPLTVATTMVGLSPPWPITVTPSGRGMSLRWTARSTPRLARSTSMKPGRSFGRQTTSISVTTWLTIAFWSLTAGETSWLRKRSGTLTLIFSAARTRWKSTCSTCGLKGCHCASRSRTCSALPSISRSRMLEWKVSLRMAWYSALWSSSMATGSLVPP